MNKLRRVVLAVLVLVSTLVFGQEKRFEVGVEGGLSRTSLWGNELLNKGFNKLTIGYSGGLAFQYNVSKTFSIRSGVGYDLKGNSSKSYLYPDISGNDIGKYRARSNFHYLTVPILGKFTIGKKGQFFINVGPYIGYLLKHNFILKVNVFEEFEDEYGKRFAEKSSVIDNLKRLDFSLTTGLGVALPVNDQLSLSLELRNNLGLYDISTLPVYNDGTIKTNSTNLLVGLSYCFGNNREE